jgi:hypothetical protein
LGNPSQLANNLDYRSIEDLLDGLVLGVHPIQWHHPALEVQALDQRSDSGNLMGLFVHGLDAQEPLAGLGNGVDQHQVGPANLLAVNVAGTGPSSSFCHSRARTSIWRRGTTWSTRWNNGVMSETASGLWH